MRIRNVTYYAFIGVNKAFDYQLAFAVTILCNVKEAEGKTFDGLWSQVGVSLLNGIGRDN